MSDKKFDIPAPNRFGEGSLFKGTARLKHAEIDPVTRRDKFGNRVFSSADRYYVDREGDKTKAALLVSPEGQRFLQKNPQLLSQIDQGLLALEHTFKQGRRAETIDAHDLGNGGSLKKLDVISGQSNIYILSLDQDKYVLKTRRPGADADQPYVNEMLQVQEIQAELGDVFRFAGVVLPEFLFASGQIACRKYVEGKPPSLHELRLQIGSFNPKVEEYLRIQRWAKNPLWKNVHTDLFGHNGLRTNNFIREPQGKLHWIDPFAYIPPDGYDH